MKLSEKLTVYTQDPQGVTLNMHELIFEIQRLEYENESLKSRLKEIHDKALNMNETVQQLDTILQRFHLGG